MTVRRGAATRGFHNRIAIVFDFDRTLSSGTVDALLKRMGVSDSRRWRDEQVGALVADGWDEILAKGWLLARTAEKHGIDLTRDFVRATGESLDCYPGVMEMLPELRQVGERASGGGEVEILVLSSGFVDLMDVSPVAGAIDRFWGSALHWDEQGRLAGVKRTVIHSEKARYLRAFAKGLDIAGANEPQDVFRHRDPGDWHVPLDQLIYVGDGASDIDAFRLVEQHGGIALAVDHSKAGEEWGAEKHIFDEARVENLAPPDFRDGSELKQSLVLAVEIVAKRVALRRLGRCE